MFALYETSSQLKLFFRTFSYSTAAVVQPAWPSKSSRDTFAVITTAQRHQAARCLT